MQRPGRGRLKRRATPWLLLGVLAASLAPVSGPVSAQGSPLSLEARVVNGTEGGGLVEGLAVTLQAVRADEGVGLWEAVVSAEGMVRFEALDPAEDLVYFLSATYREVRYFSPLFSLAEPLPEPPELRVYETTEDPSVIRILGDSTLLLGAEGAAGAIEVMQVTTYENASDRTFIGTFVPGGRVTVQLPLPPGAFEVQPVHETDTLFALEDGSVYSAMPFPPGMEDVIVTYRISYTGRGYDWQKTYPYPVGQANLFVPPQLDVEPGPELQPQSSVQINNLPYLQFVAGEGPVGTRLSARIGGLPFNASLRGAALTRALRAGVIGAAALFLAGVGGSVAFWSLRGRRSLAATGAAREAAVERLALLDQEFENGRLNKESYAAQREAGLRAARQLFEERGAS